MRMPPCVGRASHSNKYEHSEYNRALVENATGIDIFIQPVG